MSMTDHLVAKRIRLAEEIIKLANAIEDPKNTQPTSYIVASLLELQKLSKEFCDCCREGCVK
jgi:hypothetical protein